MLTDSVYWIWFQLIFGIGTRRADLMQEYFASPKEIFDGIAANNHVAGMLEEGERASSDAAMGEAVAIQRRTLRKGCEIVTPDHPDYPALLKGIPLRPAVLYVKGDLSCLGDTLSIAMVGSRHHTEYGAKVSAALADGLARGGAVVISGLAHGIDTECHRAALAACGKTVGVLGCGIDVDYPTGNRELKTAASRNGAVITEYPLGTIPHAGNFPMRNRIISGMCHGTVVVEGNLRSGSLITARLAREQGRDVYAVPGSIFEQSSQGSHQLIREGAFVAECAEDILSRYGEGLKNSAAATEPVLVAGARPPIPNGSAKNRREKPAAQSAPRPRQLPEGTGELAALVYAQFSRDTLIVDDIVSATELTPAEILTALTELEMSGFIQSHPGRRFGLI